MEEETDDERVNPPIPYLHDMSPCGLQFYKNPRMKVKISSKLSVVPGERTVSNPKTATGATSSRGLETSDPRGDGSMYECRGGSDLTMSRDDMIKENLNAHLLYISQCVKLVDIINIPHLFTREEKSIILAEKNEIHARRLALETLLGKRNDKGTFVLFRDHLNENNAYPKIIGILDGTFTPKDQNYIKVLELFTREIIQRLNPLDLLPFLQKHGVLQQSDTQEITAECKNYGDIRGSCLLLISLPCRIENWFVIFMKALIDKDLEDLAEMLDPDMYKDLVTEDNQAASNNPGMNKSRPKVPPKPTNWVKKKQQYQRRIEQLELKFSVEEYYEKIETLTNSPVVIEKFNRSMAEDDAEIVWPNIKQGYVMIRCTSQDNCEECSEKISSWKTAVKRKFEDLLDRFVSSARSQPDPSKILASKHKSGKYKCSLNKQFSKMSLQRSKSPERFSTSESCQNSKHDKFKRIVEVKLGNGAIIHVMLGPLEELEVDVMVSPSDRHLRLNAGLSETISKKAGASMQQTCSKYIEKWHSIDEADALITEAGDLPANYVIMVVSPVWRDNDPQLSEKKLREAVMKVLDKSSKSLNATSVSLPAISCGVSGFPIKIGTLNIVRAVQNFFLEEQESSLKHVYIVDIDETTVNRIHEAIVRVFKEDKSCAIQTYTLRR